MTGEKRKRKETVQGYSMTEEKMRKNLYLRKRKAKYRKIHPYRAPHRNFNHCDFSSNAIAGFKQSKREKLLYQMYKQPKTNSYGNYHVLQ